MRPFFVLLAALGLAACEPMPTSDRPLVQPGVQQPRPGLWALLDGNCPVPASADIGRWPDCSFPVWIDGGEVTFVFGGPMRTRFLIADGAPSVTQLAPSEPSRPPPFMGRPDGRLDPAPAEPWLRDYAYLAVRPEGASPFVRARVWSVPCPFSEDQSIPGLRVTDDECEVSTPAALRRLAAAAVTRDPGYRAVWIAP
jgi:hypothetical protein